MSEGSEGQVERAPTGDERREWRAMARRLVRQYPDPALRSKARAVESVDPEVRQLVERMIDVMSRAHGVGLAAPQLGVLRRVLVYRVGDGDGVKVLVNPELVDRSAETEVDTEGCLSLLGGELSVPVERHARVRVEATDGAGESVEFEAEGLEARVIQHEVDHLDGVLIFDRTDPGERRNALRELRLHAG
jgi:peptide deformylase